MDKGNPFILIDTLCQNYHWTLPEAMRLTLPQVFMLNHAATVNSKRMDERIEWDKMEKEKADKAAKLRDERDPIIPSLGKRMSECTSEEIASQFASGAW